VQVVSDAQPTVSDVSNGNFSILTPPIDISAPNGGETWAIGQSATITWTGTGFSGNVKIELNRTYPSASWETLLASTANDGTENWQIAGAVSTHSRVRITSVNTPTIGDTSAADFFIVHSAVPVINRDRHGDANPGTVTFTAKVTDDMPGVVVKLFYRLGTAPAFDSLTMTATANPNEFSATPAFAFGRWFNFLRATDSEGQAVYTDTTMMVVASPCGLPIAYDDGSAELFNWAELDSFVWAVRFTPPQTPFVLCRASIAVAAFDPDTAHAPIRIRIYSANGTAGMPGTLLREVTRGSIGNMIGGLPTPGAYTANVILCDDATEPLEVSGDFYVAALNLSPGLEAFGMDTSSALSGRSVVYDPCDGLWHAEDGSSSNARRGNRMIRVSGWADHPSQTVVSLNGAEVRLDWTSTGAVYYKIYRSADAQFSTPVYVGTATDTTLTVAGDLATHDKLFYMVKSSSLP
jgi:hypothetical protein